MRHRCGSSYRHVRGVKVDSALGKFGDFPDYLTAARAHLDAFLPYFPN